MHNSKHSTKKVLDRAQAEIDHINNELKRLKPNKGINPFQDTKSENVTTNTKPEKFTDLPISRKTMDGLEKAGYETMTEIQASSLTYSLCGSDILGAAKTGSGKTLAFCIPVIEKLWRAKWSKFDGLGALILTPSRELALQIFELLRTIGKYHSLSMGLVVGGNSKVEQEKEFICGMNVLVATPGRLLQHMDQTYGFSCDNLQILVLDEADRLLELGFQDELNNIISNLPKDRQTLLFSATQTSKMKDLTRLSLNKKNTEYVSVHEKEIMPVNLHQSYIVSPLQDKMDILFSFIKTHIKTKIIVFCTNQKQVAFLHQVFTLFNLGTNIYKLAGNLSQNVRRFNYVEFLAKHYSILFCTDVAARGLDFPKVDFVIHMEIPENEKAYIHRSGRTARFVSHGKSILMILPQETSFVDSLIKKGIEIKEQKVNVNRSVSIKDQLAAMISHDVKLKYLAMKYFEGVVKSYVKNCTAVKVEIKDLPLDEFATRLGLLEKPNITDALENTSKKEESTGKLEDSEQDEQDIDDEDLIKKPVKHKKKKLERLLTKTTQLVTQTKDYARLVRDDDVSDDELFTVKRKNHDLENDNLPDIPTKKRKGEHVLFKDGKTITPFEAIVAQREGEQDIELEKAKHGAKISKALQEKDQIDKERAKSILKEKRKRAKERETEISTLEERVALLQEGINPDEQLEEDDDEREVVLGDPDDEEEEMEEEEHEQIEQDDDANNAFEMIEDYRQKAAKLKKEKKVIHDDEELAMAVLNKRLNKKK